MKGDFDGLIEVEEMLGKLWRGLEGGESFLRERAPAYRQAAEAAGKAVLGAMRPDDVDPREWTDMMEAFCDFLGWNAVTKGVEIFYHKYEEREESGEKADIKYADVLEWVKAGPGKGGKDKSESETAEGKSDEEIAHVVANAINQYRFGFAGGEKDYGRITDRLEEFVKARFLSADLSGALASVLDAWVGVLGPMIESDFEAWVDAQLEKL